MLLLVCCWYSPAAIRLQARSPRVAQGHNTAPLPVRFASLLIPSELPLRRFLLLLILLVLSPTCGSRKKTRKSIFISALLYITIFLLLPRVELPPFVSHPCIYSCFFRLLGRLAVCATLPGILTSTCWHWRGTAKTPPSCSTAARRERTTSIIGCVRLIFHILPIVSTALEATLASSILVYFR